MLSIAAESMTDGGRAVPFAANASRDQVRDGIVLLLVSVAGALASGWLACGYGYLVKISLSLRVMRKR
jgi:hypothetical protein